MKIIDKIHSAERDGKPFFSFEFFPPKTENGVHNLYSRFDRMAEWEPLWVDVTWGAGGSTSDRTLAICETAQSLVGLETMMHLTCTNMEVSKLKNALKSAKDAGLQNILALRGDPPHGEEWKAIEGGFEHAVDLVRHIRKEYKDYFGIAVAGYPEGHIDAESYEKDLQHLKAKLDAGADLVITQLFYDCDIFLKFVKDCRAIGITAPILPGIMPIQTYGGFMRMTTLCKTSVPQAIYDALEPLKDDDAKVKEYGVQLGIEMCKKLLANGVIGLHFYTLNLEKSVVRIMKGLGIAEDPHLRKPLPFRAIPAVHRAEEDVRPIFWRHRPKSYISRTDSWDDFPNGRWGDNRSPAYGELTDYHLASLHFDADTDYAALWGTPTTVKDLCDVFVQFARCELPKLPWSEEPLHGESLLIQRELIWLNQNGFLTINSQPQVNGLPSDNADVGWGGPGGFIYQKGYVEFFVSPENFRKLKALFPKYPSLTYHAVDLKTESIHNTDGTTAVTWGVFPGREIIQPTVVNTESFQIWKDEAYALWTSRWASVYPEDSPSRKLLTEIRDTWYLVNVVENDFIKGSVFNILKEAIGSSP